ncbi:hypothetical protein [Ramlibacter humi]|uniref:hypothetical protein n=1 Tax=Ramlibacter humi TaxID=2530451 RepID=UPI001EF0B9B7|nr:hypothetical protein [Ramlibacter humi]
MRFRFLSRAARTLIALAAFACATSIAGPLPGGLSLGMTVPEMQQAQPGLKRVPHPARLAGGLVGSWSADEVRLAGVALLPTFYIADGQLARVEYLAREGGPASYSSLLAWARGTWGAELASNAPEGSYASWEGEEVDAYLQLANTAAGPQTRLVIKRRVLKDASEL